MAKQTWQARIVTWLIAQGYSEGKQLTKYRVFTSPTVNNKKYFVGYAGGVRMSTSGTVSTSMSVTDTIHRRVVSWEKMQCQKA